ncbi:MAG: YoaK family protein [Acidimicrobiales bacterium]|jgi:uncharacterized membrane protein YoaK (UPF0700 family)
MENRSPSRPEGHPPQRRHHVAVTLLAMTSGALDAIGFLGLGGVFASVMTGNLVLLGLSAGTRNSALAAHAAVAVSGYAIGVGAGARVVWDRSDIPTQGWSRRLHHVLVVELVLVVGFSIGWELTVSRTSTSDQLVLIGIAATAMGLQSATVRAWTGAATSTTYLTGTLTGVVGAVAAGRPLRQEWAGVAVLAAALVGAALAGVALAERSALAPVVPLVTLVGVLVIGRTLVADAGAATSADGAQADAP